jgi:hypothetical protein
MGRERVAPLLPIKESHMSRLVPALLALALVGCPLARAQPLPAAAGVGSDDDPLNSRERARRLRQAQQADPRQLIQELRNEANSAFAERMRRVEGGTDTPDALLDESGRVLAAERAAGRGRDEGLAALGRYWARLREVEQMTWERVEAGIKRFTAADYWAVRGQRLLAESRLIQELGGAAAAGAGAFRTAGDEDDPLASRLTARARFEAARATPAGPARAALDAARREYEFLVRRIMGGTETPDVIHPIMARRVAAEGVLGQGPGDYLGSLEGLWYAAWFNELLILQRIAFGIKNFGPAEYYAAHDARLETEIRIVEARRQAGRTLPLRGGLQDPFAEVEHPLDTRDVAQAKSAAARADVRQLNETRRDVLRAAYAYRITQLWAGGEVPDAASAVSRRLLGAELALATRHGERLAALEQHCARAGEIEDLTRERVGKGIRTFTQVDYHDTRFERIQAELWLAEARAAKE